MMGGSMDKERLCVIMRQLIPVARMLEVLETQHLSDLVNRTVEQMRPEDLLAMATVADAAAHILRKEAGVVVPTGPLMPISA
jgi:hypothetical protein